MPEAGLGKDNPTHLYPITLSTLLVLFLLSNVQMVALSQYGRIFCADLTLLHL